ncbi:DNA polymerase III subunit alpha [Candidatus Saccharibacteria bacterium]|nr:DNA polymerase III subunit alpha [Candidatus Saccharibacteria bacterium]
MTKTLSSKDYVHLHNHTQYSLLDGLTKIPQLMDFVANAGMDAVAITDHGTLSGSLEFYKEAAKHKVKPIIGMETYVAPRTMADKDPAKDKSYYHLIILAMDNNGYKNLIKLSTEANLNGFYYKPRIDKALLKKYSQGLIILSGCIGGEIGDALKQGQYEEAKKIVQWYKSIFGDRYYLEVQDHGHPEHPKSWTEQVKITELTFRLAKELDIECVLTCDAHYLSHEDQDAHEILLCVQTGSFLNDDSRMTLKNFDLHVTDPKELISRWGKEHPEVISNSRAIADRCKVSIELGKILIPKFDVPKGYSEKSYLEELVYQGLAWRYCGIEESKAKTMLPKDVTKILPDDVVDRASYELGIIEQMGFNGYFLIIADFINWGKDNGIVFGPGRGSAAGSIISYSLKITELDPLKYDLLFERFLNPDRISMPDIDIDIQDSRRDEVIQYCVEKYGDDRVANIVTFGRMAARNAVRDVSRVLQVPYAEADRLAKMIPPPVQGRHIPLEKSLNDDQALKEEYENNEQSKKVFDLAVQLDGTIRSHGVHAAGVVIAPDRIVEFTPLEMAQKGVVTTQYPMGPIEDLGLLKIDFLGLSNLTIIKNTLRIIKKVNNKEIDINKIPLDDEKTYELLRKGATTGVFQLESAGMKRYLRELRPTIFEDIIAMGALYRPGPLTAGLTDKFIARKNGKEKVLYDHELMEPALRDTYGVMVYQEQFMQIVRDMCGFTGGEADTLRKAVGKKIREMMITMKDKVIEGGVSNNVPKSIVEKFWKDLEGFADYAFNKSHAACYGFISYQTAYLKAHYPEAFMAALMTSDYDNIDRLAIEVTECKNMGIEVLPPDINESFIEFAIVPGKEQIRFGLSAIKNVGIGAVEEILTARTKGEFATIEDFFMRINPRIVNRKTMESLIKSGSLDRCGSRDYLLHNLDVLIAFASKEHKKKVSGQTDLFGVDDDSTENLPQINLSKPIDSLSKRDQLIWERELLGIYLSSHPLQEFESILSEKAVPLAKIAKEHEGKTVSVGGIVTNTREIVTKNGQKMAFISIEDHSGEIELVVFPKVYDESLELLEKDRVILVKGKISTKNNDGGIKVIANSINEITHDQAIRYKGTGKKVKIPEKGKIPTKKVIREEKVAKKRLYIKIPNTKDHSTLTSLRDIIDKNPGNLEVVLVIGNNSDRQVIKLPFEISEDGLVIDKIKQLISSNDVIVQ